MVIRSVFLRLAIMLVLLLVCSACFAQVKVNLAWDLSASDAMLGPTGGYNLYETKTAGVYGTVPVLKVAPGINAATVTSPYIGNVCFVATAVDSEGNESAKSNEPCTILKPEAATNVNIPPKTP